MQCFGTSSIKFLLSLCFWSILIWKLDNFYPIELLGSEICWILGLSQIQCIMVLRNQNPQANILWKFNMKWHKSLYTQSNPILFFIYLFIIINISYLKKRKEKKREYKIPKNPIQHLLFWIFPYLKNINQPVISKQIDTFLFISKIMKK